MKRDKDEKKERKKIREKMSFSYFDADLLFFELTSPVTIFTVIFITYRCYF